MSRKLTAGVLRLTLAWLVFSGISPVNAHSPFDPQATGGELDRLRRGEVLIRALPASEATRDVVQASVLIGAPAERVWNVMNDCDRATRFMPGLKACKVLEQNKEGEVIEHRVRYSWLFPEVTYSFQARYDPVKKVNFHRLSGDLKEFRGSWKLEPLDAGQKTLVFYSVYIDPGFFIPRGVITYLLRRDLPDMMTALREEVQTPAP
jgi:ribosome-associated toxin RatA of RatAB toxin-antitoxin module